MWQSRRSVTFWTPWQLWHCLHSSRKFATSCVEKWCRLTTSTAQCWAQNYTRIFSLLNPKSQWDSAEIMLMYVKHSCKIHQGIRSDSSEERYRAQHTLKMSAESHSHNWFMVASSGKNHRWKLAKRSLTLELTYQAQEWKIKMNNMFNRIDMDILVSLVTEYEVGTEWQKCYNHEASVENKHRGELKPISKYKVQGTKQKIYFVLNFVTAVTLFTKQCKICYKPRRKMVQTDKFPLLSVERKNTRIFSLLNPNGQWDLAEPVLMHEKPPCKQFIKESDQIPVMKSVQEPNEHWKFQLNPPAKLNHGCVIPGKA